MEGCKWEMWARECVGNGDQGMQETQALLVPSCPSPPLTGRGSSSWELAVPQGSLSFVWELGAEPGNSPVLPIGAEGIKYAMGFPSHREDRDGGIGGDPVRAGRAIQGTARPGLDF